MSEKEDPNDAHNDEIEEKLINEDFKIWRKNTPFLYDMVVTTALEWPSLTVDWMTAGTSQGECSVQRLLLGTHTAGEEQNFVLVVEIHLPREDREVDMRKYESHPEYAGCGMAGGDGPRFQIVTKMNHPGEVNRTLHMPQEEFVFATKTVEGDVLFFDYSKHPTTPVDSSVKPEKVLTGHRKEGWGLSWNSFEKGRLASGGEDARICVWDVLSDSCDAASTSACSVTGDSGNTIKSHKQAPLAVFTGHANSVVDVAWSYASSDILASVSDDHKLMLWDMRKGNTEEPVQLVEAHTSEVNSLSFNPYSPYLIATGGADAKVNLWDIRKLDTRLHSMEGHRNEVLRVHFSPFNETIVGSASSDRRVNIWDMSRIGQQQSVQDAEDGPPELLFVHGGHTEKISDFSWNHNENCDWIIASVADDNIVQIWQPAESIYLDDDDVDEPADDSNKRMKDDA